MCKPAPVFYGAKRAANEARRWRMKEEDVAMRSVRDWCAIIMSLSFARFGLTESFYEATCDSVVSIRVPKVVCENINGTWHEVWLRSVATGNPVAKMKTDSGTGFLLLHSNAAYVVTAKHVVVDGAGRASVAGDIWLNVKDSPARSLAISFMAEGRHGWFLHPTADVAVLPYGRPTDLNVNAKDMPEAWVSTNSVSMLNPVFAVGFPMGLGVGNVLEPVAKRCQVSAPRITLDGNTNSPSCILLDEALAQGYSGAPVFIDIPPGVMQHNFRLVGLMSAVKSDMSGGKVSYVVPISAVMDIFSSEEFKKYESSKGLPGLTLDKGGSNQKK
jgi:S1-C subfamily serine protease